MNWLFTVGVVLAAYGIFLLCGDNRTIASFAERYHVRILLTVALGDFGLPRYRRYIGGVCIIIMGIILLLLAATGHRAEP